MDAALLDRADELLVDVALDIFKARNVFGVLGLERIKEALVVTGGVDAANGAPLSVLIRSGNPYVVKQRCQLGFASAKRTDSSASHSSSARENASVTVSG